jgi:hypothetical protein
VPARTDRGRIVEGGGQTVTLLDGRKVGVQLLDNEDVRIKVEGGPYVVPEFYLQGRRAADSYVGLKEPFV